MRFADRAEAGRVLAARLDHLRGEDLVVLGLPRGGVPVAYEVARALGAPLDVIVVRKLGVPAQPELGMGAIGENGVRIINREVVTAAGVTQAEIEAVERRERQELDRRARRFRGDRPPVPLGGRTAVVIDDGIATGSTARAACSIAKAEGAARVVLAVPVAPRGWTTRMEGAADELVAAETPTPFRAIGQFYADFTQTTDSEVVACLERAGTPAGGAVEQHDGFATDMEMAAGSVALQGQLTVPGEASGIVVFVHGSGSSRHSPRNQQVAASLKHAGMATLLFDLLTKGEEGNRANVFDIGKLAERLGAVTATLRRDARLRDLPCGYFGASTGAAAALWAAAEPDARIAAIVSRGGRPDLAGPRLADVRAPTLLIVGGADLAVLDLNRQAYASLVCQRRLEIVPGATHLFEEPGTLDQVAALARGWFARSFSAAKLG